MVAAGKFDVFLRLAPASNPNYREKIWDHAAGSLIVEEAGGVVTDVSGKRFDFSQGRALEKNQGVVVSNGHFHNAIVEFFARG
jgi:3'(2'), 5'-bisphosphate nucleotidase